MKTTKHIDDGFNRIKPWLSKKLEERGLSVDKFSVATGSVIDPTAIRRWYADVCRPYARTMKIVCETLSKMPVIKPDGSRVRVEVPWWEGLASYQPRPRAWLAHYANRPTPSPTPKRKSRSPQQGRSRSK